MASKYLASSSYGYKEEFKDYTTAWKVLCEKYELTPRHAEQLKEYWGLTRGNLQLWLEVVVPRVRARRAREVIEPVPVDGCDCEMCVRRRIFQDANVEDPCTTEPTFSPAPGGSNTTPTT